MSSYVTNMQSGPEVPDVILAVMGVAIMTVALGKYSYRPLLAAGATMGVLCFLFAIFVYPRE